MRQLVPQRRTSSGLVCHSPAGSHAGQASALISTHHRRCRSGRYGPVTAGTAAGRCGSCARSSFQHGRRPPGRSRAACSAATASVQETKVSLLEAVVDTNRGIFGVQADQRRQILGLIEQLEAAAPAENITERLECVSGDWRLLFSTISITGKRRTKLGLRQFITLGEFTQSIDLKQQRAINQIEFNVSGIAFLNGALRVEASYQVTSPQRVTIDFESATLKPSQLQELFEQNFELLLSIFNPAGWLDITFVDDSHRIGRDDKGNVFLLERL